MLRSSGGAESRSRSSPTRSYYGNTKRFCSQVADPQGEECPQGTPLKKGARIRLQHVNTRAWLHSHHFSSPLTQNQEARPAHSPGLASVPPTMRVTMRRCFRTPHP